MAKKDTQAFDDWDDFEDFSMFDDGMGEGGFKSTTKKGKAREAVGVLSGGFVSGVKKSLFSRNFYQAVVGKALPREYSTALDKGLEAKDTIGDLYDTAYRESEKVNDKLTKGVKPIVDKYGDKLPKRMARPLRKWTRDVKSTSVWTTENKEELESVAALNDIFSKREQTRSIKNTSIQSQVQTGIAKNSMDLTARLVTQTQSLVAYQDQIDSAWKRKTLELQYKQFFVQRKSLDTHEQLLALSRESFTLIAKNTALPDLVKAQSTEVAGRMMTEKMYGAIFNQFSGLPSNVLRSLSSNVLKKMKSGSRDLQESLMGGLDTIHQLLEDGGDANDTLGARGSTRLAGEGGGEMAAGPIGRFIGKKLKKKYGDNEKVKHGANVLSGLMGRIPRIFNGAAQGEDTGSRFVDMLLELMDAKNTLSTNTGTVMKNHDGMLDEQMYFDLLTKKSITEIIPGYLARIHHELRTTRTGDASHPLLAFDFEKGVFSNEAKLTKRLKDRTLGTYNKQALKSVEEDLFKSLNLKRLAKQKGGPAIIDELFKQLGLASLNNRDFTLQSMIGDSNTSLDAKQKNKFKVFLKRQFKIEAIDVDDNESLIEKIKGSVASQYGTSREGAQAQRNINDAMTNLQRYVGNPTGELNKAARRGQINTLLELGIVDEKNGEYVLNKEKYLAALRDGTVKPIDPENPDDFNPNPPKPPKTATKKYIDELADKATKKFKEVTEGDRAQEVKTKMRETKDAAGNLITTSIDAAGNIVSEVKDKLGNIVTSSESPDGTIISVTRDKAGKMVVEAKDAAGNVMTATKDKAGQIVTSGKSVSAAVTEDIKTKGVKQSAKDVVSKVSEAIPDKVEIERKRMEAIRAFNKIFTSEKMDKLKEKYGKNDKITAAMDFITAKHGVTDFGAANIRTAYASYPKFRIMVDEIMAEQAEEDSLLGGAKKAATDKFKSATEAASESGKKAKRKAKKAANKVKNAVDDALGAKPTQDDFADAEDYAEGFIKENTLEDKDGEVKQSLMRDFFKQRFGAADVFDKFVKSGKAVSGALDRGKIVIGSKGSTGLAGSAAGDAIGLLFQLGKYAAKAGAIMSKPGLAAMKIVPWGVKKLIGLFVETVNFSAVQHALWLPGEREPRMLKTGLMTGRYVNGDGDVIEKPKDIKGDIYDTMTEPNELIMTASEYKKGLYDSTGKLIYKPPTLIGKITTGLVKLPFIMAKAALKLTGKLFMGYLKVTTMPVTWMINKILGEKRIEPKLHAELVHLGLTDQTNKALNNIGEILDDRLPGGKKKHNDKDGDGNRDGSADDVRENKKKKKEEKDKKDGVLSRFFGKKKKKKNGEEDDEEGDTTGLLDLLGKGKMAGRLAGLARNPYVMGGLAIAGLLGWEGLSDERKNADPDDIANKLLPDMMKDSKAARMGVRLSEKLVNVALIPGKLTRKAAVKVTEWVERGEQWANRKGSQTGDAIKLALTSIGGGTMGFLFGDKAKRTWNKNFNIDNVSPLLRFRLAQYGFRYNDKTSVESILKFEDDILQSLTPASSTQPARISDSITIEQSAAYFGVSVNDEDDLTEWVAWYANRFRPVFLSSVTVMQRLGHPGKSLHEIDSLLTKGQKLEFLDKANFYRGAFNPYDIDVSPLPTEYTLKYGNKYKVEEVRQEQLEEVKLMSDDPKDAIIEKERSLARTSKQKEKALNNKKDVVAEKRFDPYKNIDSVNFASLTGATKQDKSINDVIQPKDNKFGGGGAGGEFDAKAKEAAEVKRAADIKEHGAVGEMLSGIAGAFGSMFVQSAHASTFIPEMQYGGATAPMGTTTNKATTAATIATTAAAATATAGTGAYKATSPDGASSTSIADKPYVAARFARENAKAESSGGSTKSIKNALVKAGYSFTAPAAASDYPAKALPEMGFSAVDNNSAWLVGDIMVFSSNKYYKNGHIQIYDGANWISDYIQPNWIPFPDNVPTFTLWRDTEFVKSGNFSPDKRKTDELAKSVAEQTKAATASNKLASTSASSSDSKTDKKSETKGVIAKTWDQVKSVGNTAWESTKEVVGNAATAVGDAINSAGTFFSNAMASMSGSQKEWQMRVYQAFKNAGFSEQQARILTAEIGRENSYNPSTMFGGHADPHSGSNVGMLSWQKARVKPLLNFLQQAGVLNGTKITPGQAALDAQAKFIMHEMKTTYSKVGSRFLAQPNIDYAAGVKMIGIEYIAWRFNDPKYAQGHKNRDGFYNMLLKQLGSGATASAEKPAGNNASKAVAAATPAAASSARPGVTAASLAANTMGPVPVKAKDNANAALLGGIMPQSKFPVGKVKPGEVLPNYTGVVNDADAPVGKPAGGATPWMTVALSQMGINEDQNTAITNSYHAIGAGQTKWDSRSVPWCASFVGWVLNKAGLKHPVTGRAIDYKQFGKKLSKDNIPYGAIMVMKIGSGNHVCFCHEDKGTSVVMLGGNQSSKKGGNQRNGGEVTLSTISKSCVVQVVYPNDFTPGNGAAAGGQYGSAGGGPAAGNGRAPVPIVKMKYNDYTGYDAKIKDNFNNGTAVTLNNAISKDPAKAEVISGTTTAAAVGKEANDTAKKQAATTAKTVAKTPAQTPAKTNSPQATTSPMANSLVSSFAPTSTDDGEWKPDFSFGGSLMPTEKPDSMISAIQKQTSKNLSQKMAEVENRQSNDALSESSQMLRESLKVQKQMLDRLTSIDSHMSAVSKGQKTRDITESSDNNTPTKQDKGNPQKQQNHQVKRPGRDEPMSMAKML